MNRELKLKLEEVISEIRAEVGDKGIVVYLEDHGAELVLADWETSNWAWQSSDYC